MFEKINKLTEFAQKSIIKMTGGVIIDRLTSERIIERG